MAKLDIGEVKHIAKLSRLTLKDNELEKFQDQMSSILSYVEKLETVDTDNIEPCSNITGLSNVFVEDKVLEKSVSHEDIAKNAPRFNGESFVVPGVFE